MASSSQHAWGGVTGSWIFQGGSHYFEVRVEKGARLGLGLYVGLVDAAYKPHLRGQGMNSVMVPAKCAYEYERAWAFYAHNGDLVRRGKTVGRPSAVGGSDRPRDS